MRSRDDLCVKNVPIRNIKMFRGDIHTVPPPVPVRDNGRGWFLSYGDETTRSSGQNVVWIKHERGQCSCQRVKLRVSARLIRPGRDFLRPPLLFFRLLYLLPPHPCAQCIIVRGFVLSDSEKKNKNIKPLTRIEF